MYADTTRVPAVFVLPSHSDSIFLSPEQALSRKDIEN
jgi:hypothetical protein